VLSKGAEATVAWMTMTEGKLGKRLLVNQLDRSTAITRGAAYRFPQVTHQ